MTGHVARMGDTGNAYKLLVGKPETTRKNLRERGWEGVEWLHLAQNRGLRRAFVDTVMIFQVP
jgi:hypothetical protein